MWRVRHVLVGRQPYGGASVSACACFFHGSWWTLGLAVVAPGRVVSSSSQASFLSCRFDVRSRARDGRTDGRGFPRAEYRTDGDVGKRAVRENAVSSQQGVALAGRTHFDFLFFSFGLLERRERARGMPQLPIDRDSNICKRRLYFVPNPYVYGVCKDGCSSSSLHACMDLATRAINVWGSNQMNPAGSSE